jgi:MoaA/NifB/PqqE/SkfB family radical SAM enzyme
MKKISTYFNKLRALGLRKFITTAYIKKIRTWYPDMISVEIMTKCNLKCKHCRVTYHGNLIEDVVPAFMEFDFFTKIIDRISPLVKKATSFQFSTIEPLFHKDIFKMMDYVSGYNRNIEYNLLSNGMLLNEKNIKELLKRNVPSVTVSLDGCTAKTVESFKTNTNFDTVVSNIRRFKQISKDKIKLNVIFVSTKNNIHELIDYIEFCKKLEVDRIMVNGFLSFLPELSDLALYSRQGNSEVHEIFKRFHETAKRAKIEVELPSLMTRPQGCGYISIMTIDEKGNVSPCILLARKTPLALFTDSSVVGPVIFGNIFESDAASIWRSDKSVRFRSMLKKHIIPKECSLCADAYGVICSNRELLL